MKTFATPKRKNTRPYDQECKWKPRYKKPELPPIVKRPLPSFDYYDLLRSICTDSFYEFLKEFWHTFVTDEPVWNWHIEVICDELQVLAERVIAGKPKLYDLIINVPPGTTKSTIVSEAFPAWVWTRFPQAKFICGSYADDLSLDLSRKCRDIVQSELYQKLWPHLALRSDQNVKSYFMNASGGMRYATSTGASVIGMHGHFVILDDPMDPEGAESEAEVKQINRWISHTIPSRKVNKVIAPTIMVQQRVGENDPTAARLKNVKAGAVRHVCLPAELGDNVRPKHLRLKYSDEGLLDPVRLPRVVLDAARAELGEYNYAGQYDQNPVPKRGGMFKTGRFKVGPLPHYQRIKRTMRFWDNATTPDGGAYSVGVKIAQTVDGYYYVIHVARGQWDEHEREEQKLMYAKSDGRSCYVGQEVEPGSGGKDQAAATVRNLAGYTVILCPVGQSEGNKVNRAGPFAAMVNSGNVYLVPGDWHNDYTSELQHFPRGKYKDQVDASAGAFNWLADRRLRAGVM